MSVTYLDPAHPIVSGKVSLHVGGLEYFADLETTIEELQAGDTLLLMNWYIEPEFFFVQDLDETAAWQDSHVFVIALADAVNRGVDVRVLLWVNSNLFEPLYPLEHNPEFVSDLEDITLGSGNLEEALTGERKIVPALEDAIYGAALSVEDSVRRDITLPFKDVMRLNLKTVYRWRNEPYAGGTPLQNRVVINTLDSALGGSHAKFALVLKAKPNGIHGQAFTGGIDLARDRYSIAPYLPKNSATINYWHDIMAKVEGSDAVAPMYDLFKTLWNANVDRKNTYNPNITAFYEDQSVHVDCVPAGATYLEDKTFDPAHNFTTHKLQSVLTMPDTFQLFGSAANPGVGEPVIAAYPDGHFSYKAALERAFEKADFYIYIEDQAQQSLEIHALAIAAIKRSPTLRVIMVRGTDPADDVNDIADKIIKRDRYDQLTDSEKLRFILYDINYAIHSKLFLIDDRVAIVGSGGHFTRSLSEEIEHGVAFIDDVNDSTKNLTDIRNMLWTLHTGVDFGQPPYDNLANALQVWDTPPSNFGELFDDTGASTGTQMTRLDWDALTLTPFPNVESDIATLLNIDIPLAEDVPPQYAPTHSEYLKYIDEQAEIFLHMVAYEWPYQSWQNPFALPEGSTLPRIDKKTVPINVATTMALDGPAANQVTWAYVPADGLTVLDAAPDTFNGSEFSVRFRTPGSKLVVATVTSSGNATPQKVPFIIQVLENSGPDWTDLYPKSTELNDLSESFRQKVINFRNTLQAAGIPQNKMPIVTTYRPPERAFLMASSYLISQKGTSPEAIEPLLPHIPISWVHHDLNGNPDLAASTAAAEALFDAYGIPSKAVYPSEHMRREAIDMVINITGAVVVNYGGGQELIAEKQSDLAPVAEAFGIHYIAGTNHWSSSGG